MGVDKPTESRDRARVPRGERRSVRPSMISRDPIRLYSQQETVAFLRRLLRYAARSKCMTIGGRLGHKERKRMGFQLSTSKAPIKILGLSKDGCSLFRVQT